MSESKNEYWIIDTHFSDADQIIIELLTQHLNVVAITTVGRLDINTIQIKMLIENKLKELNKDNIPVYAGADRPYVNYQQDLGDEKIHNPYIREECKKDTNSEVDLNKVATLKIVELVEKYGKDLNILTTGPLTNLSLVSLLDSSLCSKFKNLYIAGGSVDNIGNSGNMAEYNFRYDPVAAQIVFRYYSNNICLIPLEVERAHSTTLTNNLELLKSNLGVRTKNLLVEVNNKNSTLDRYNNYTYSNLSLFAALVIINPKILRANSESLQCHIDIIGRKTRGAILIAKYPHVNIFSDKHSHQAAIVEIINKLDDKILIESLTRLFS